MRNTIFVNNPVASPLKRPREEGEPGPTSGDVLSPSPSPVPPPAKKPRLDMVYVLTRTDFADDYKSHGRDWSDTKILGVYHSLGVAERVLRRDQLDFVTQYLYDTGSEEDDQYFHKDKDGIRGRARKSRIRDNLSYLVDRFTDGEFVARKVRWDIQEVTGTPDDAASAASSSSSSSSSDDEEEDNEEEKDGEI